MNNQQKRKALQYALFHLKSSILTLKQMIAESEQRSLTILSYNSLLYEQEQDLKELQSLYDKLL